MADREIEVVAKLSSGVSGLNSHAWDRLGGRRPVRQPRFPVRAGSIRKRRQGNRLDPRDRSWSRTASPHLARRGAGLFEDATARANMCSTKAGRMRSSERADPIIPSSRSPFRSRRCRGRGCSASSPSTCSERPRPWSCRTRSRRRTSRSSTRREQRKRERRGWLIRHGIQYHWHSRGYGNFDDFLDALTSRKRKAIRKEREAARRGPGIQGASRGRDRTRRVGLDVALLPGHRSRENGASPTSPANSST